MLPVPLGPPGTFGPPIFGCRFKTNASKANLRSSPNDGPPAAAFRKRNALDASAKPPMPKLTNTVVGACPALSLICQPYADRLQWLVCGRLCPNDAALSLAAGLGVKSVRDELGMGESCAFGDESAARVHVGPPLHLLRQGPDDHQSLAPGTASSGLGWGFTPSNPTPFCLTSLSTPRQPREKNTRSIKRSIGGVPRRHITVC